MQLASGELVIATAFASFSARKSVVFWFRLCFANGVRLLVSCFRQQQESGFLVGVQKGCFGLRGICYYDGFYVIFGMKLGGVLLFRLCFEKGVCSSSRSKSSSSQQPAAARASKQAAGSQLSAARSHQPVSRPAAGSQQAAGSSQQTVGAAASLLNNNNSKIATTTTTTTSTSTCTTTTTTTTSSSSSGIGHSAGT